MVQVLNVVVEATLKKQTQKKTGFEHLYILKLENHGNNTAILQLLRV